MHLGTAQVPNAQAITRFDVEKILVIVLGCSCARLECRVITWNLPMAKPRTQSSE